MKINMKVKMVNSGYIMDEEYDLKAGTNAENHAQDMIDRFNAGLRPGESPRELISVEIIEEISDEIEHNWEKQNLVTLKNNVGYHDKYKCSSCGITGKIYGISGTVTRDSKYKAKIYNECHSAKKQLEKLAARRENNARARQ